MANTTLERIAERIPLLESKLADLYQNANVLREAGENAEPVLVDARNLQSKLKKWRNALTSQGITVQESSIDLE